jgi:hypothetical protein
MNLQTLKDSLTNDSPPAGLSVPLQALWYQAKGDWTAAHDLLQNQNDPAGCWVHALLHREEGDMPNANYWYRRAGRSMFEGSLEEEWDAIVEALLEE